MADETEPYSFARTKALIHRNLDLNSPIQELINILESTIELLNYPKNDFAWSYWESCSDAVAEVQKIVNFLKSGGIPRKEDVSILFLPTGSLQEVSLSSGWGDGFLKIAEKYDTVEQVIWK